ncbi:MAG TPA: hypothetical protein VMG10_29905 [Gemmataceae bacterium]|nr:hypothetical protein [Gemmataceae bacterium]
MLARITVLLLLFCMAAGEVQMAMPFEVTEGVARVDRRPYADVIGQSTLPVQPASEYTELRNLIAMRGEDRTEVRLRVHPGDVQVVYFTIVKSRLRLSDLLFSFPSRAWERRSRSSASRPLAGMR